MIIPILIFLIAISPSFVFRNKNKKLERQLKIANETSERVNQALKELRAEIYFRIKISKFKEDSSLEYLLIDNSDFKHGYTSQWLPYASQILQDLLDNERNITCVSQDMGSTHGSAINFPSHTKRFYLVRATDNGTPLTTFKSKPDKIYDKK